MSKSAGHCQIRIFARLQDKWFKHNQPTMFHVKQKKRPQNADAKFLNKTKLLGQRLRSQPGTYRKGNRQ